MDPLAAIEALKMLTRRPRADTGEVLQMAESAGFPPRFITVTLPVDCAFLT